MGTSPDSVQGRSITAFFDTDGAAKKAVDDLVAAGIPSQHISRTAGRTADAEASETGDSHGFWDNLKHLFLPDDDRGTYAEGLHRGGHLVSVRTEEGSYNRVADILDKDGAVDMGAREGEWRTEGWSGFSAARAPSATGLAASPAATDTAWRNDDTARAAALGASPIGTPVGFAETASVARRDTNLDRPRLRGYTLPHEAFAETGAAGAPAFAAADASRITEHMDVISADGQKIGEVDHLDGPDRIKLTKNSSPDGQHHDVPFTWIDHVDTHVHLKKTLAEIKAVQRS